MTNYEIVEFMTIHLQCLIEILTIQFYMHQEDALRNQGK